MVERLAHAKDSAAQATHRAREYCFIQEVRIGNRINRSQNARIPCRQANRRPLSSPAHSSPKEFLNITEETLGYIRMQPMAGASEHADFRARKQPPNHHFVARLDVIRILTAQE